MRRGDSKACVKVRAGIDALNAGDYDETVEHFEAARTSPEFAKYKAITLGQCVPVGSGDPESPGTNI